MTGGRGRCFRGGCSSNCNSSDVEARAAKASGVGAVSGVKCGICVTSLGDNSIGCDSCNSRYHPTYVCLGLPNSYEWAKQTKFLLAVIYGSARRHLIGSKTFIVHGPRADFRCRGVIRPESSPHVFLLPQTLNLKKKSRGHLSVVAFGSERPLSENIYTFWNIFAATFNTTFKGFNFIEL